MIRERNTSDHRFCGIHWSNTASQHVQGDQSTQQHASLFARESCKSCWHLQLLRWQLLSGGHVFKQKRLGGTGYTVLDQVARADENERLKCKRFDWKLSFNCKS